MAEIRADMVANVMEIYIAEGDTIAIGDTVVLLESMKMEIPVISEVAGKIVRLAVTQGDVVQEGYIIVTPGDIVLDPSAQRAFVNGIYEGKEFEFVDGILHERVVNTIKTQYKSSMTMQEQVELYAKTFNRVMGYIRESIDTKGGL
jgi:multidrug efflux pump subunit AcrA (membrane-fusion protein)